MTREELRQIIESEGDVADKITEILNRHHVEVSQVKSDPETQRKIENLESQLKDTKRALSDTKRTLKSTEEEKADTENLQGQLESKNKEIESLKEEIKRGKIENSLGVVLAQAGIKNQKFADLIKKSIDMSSVDFDDEGNVTGIEEQIQAFKEDEDTAVLFRIEPDKNNRQSYNPLKGESRNISIVEQMLEQEKAEREQVAPVEDPFLSALK